jgi:hypothetical protein
LPTFKAQPCQLSQTSSKAACCGPERQVREAVNCRERGAGAACPCLLHLA